jgi:N4-gp56 family major capsid protein
MTWQWDAPAGVYKDHALSSKIRMAALADALFLKFATPEEGFGKGQGQSVTITKVGKLPLARRVAETEELPTNRASITTKTITVSEWGSKLTLTSHEINLTHYNLSAKMKQTLTDQMRLTQDKMVADAMKLTPYKFIPLAAGSVFDTDGVPSAVADRNLNISDLRMIKDELSGNLKCPPRQQGYVGILSTRAARGIKNDPEYKDWQAPTDPGPFRDGRLRNVEGMMLIECNHWVNGTDEGALDDSIGSGGVLGEAVFFGADAVALAIVEEPELRMGIPQDLGRQREIGWYGTEEAGLPWDLASEARVIHVTSQ